MTRILCIESSTDVCSVCISEDGHTIGLQESLEPKAHTRLMTILIQNSMEEANLGFDELDAIAISAGPGSYTSLRIGSSTAKAIAYALQIPLISICTLQALAYSITVADSDAIISLLDARREEVYYNIYNNERMELQAPEPHILSKDSFQIYLNKYNNIYLVGNGAVKTKHWLKSDKFILVENICSAVNMTQLAYVKFQNEIFVDVAYFNPNYIKGVNITKSKKPAF